MSTQIHSSHPSPPHTSTPTPYTGNDVVIDVATIRPFTVEEGHFLLLPITIGDRCSVGLKSQIAAGAVLSPGTNLGPLSSSHEQDDAEPHYRHYCRPSFKPPPAYMILLLGCPVLLCVLAVGLIPWYYALLFMVTTYCPLEHVLYSHHRKLFVIFCTT
jgi:hypothetical protein